MGYNFTSEFKRWHGACSLQGTVCYKSLSSHIFYTYELFYDKHSWETPLPNKIVSW